MRDLPTDRLGLALIAGLRAGWIREDGSVRSDELARDLAPCGIHERELPRAVRLLERAAREVLTRRER